MNDKCHLDSHLDNVFMFGDFYQGLWGTPGVEACNSMYDCPEIVHNNKIGCIDHFMTYILQKINGIVRLCKLSIA